MIAERVPNSNVVNQNEHVAKVFLIILVNLCLLIDVMIKCFNTL